MGNSTGFYLGRITHSNNGLLWLEKVRNFFLFFFTIISQASNTGKSKTKIS